MCVHVSLCFCFCFFFVLSSIDNREFFLAPTIIFLNLALCKTIDMEMYSQCLHNSNCVYEARCWILDSSFRVSFGCLKWILFFFFCIFIRFLVFHLGKCLYFGCQKIKRKNKSTHNDKTETIRPLSQLSQWHTLGKCTFKQKRKKEKKCLNENSERQQSKPSVETFVINNNSTFWWAFCHYLTQMIFVG